MFFFTKHLVEQLRERRDKLRERLKHGPHETLQEYLKMGRFDILYKLNTLFSVCLSSSSSSDFFKITTNVTNPSSSTITLLVDIAMFHYIVVK